MSAASRNRQPWPMKWIVVAIILFIVPYTYLTLHFRKPGPAFRPYEDMQKRANVARLLSAGYRRIPLPAELPADSMRPIDSAPVSTIGGGLPPALGATLAQGPLLPSAITKVAAPADVNAADSYVVRFACSLPDHRRQLAGADLYVKDDQLVFAPDYEKTAGELHARSTENVIQLTVPPGVLTPGSYHVTLAGQQSSRTWMLQVH